MPYSIPAVSSPKIITALLFEAIVTAAWKNNQHINKKGGNNDKKKEFVFSDIFEYIPHNFGRKYTHLMLVCPA